MLDLGPCLILIANFEHFYTMGTELKVKGIFTDSNNIFLWQESEDRNKKAYIQNFSWFQFYVFKLRMIMCVSLLP